MKRPAQHSPGTVPRYLPVIPNPDPLALPLTTQKCGSPASQELKINQLISTCLMGSSAQLKHQIPPAMIGEGWLVEPNLLGAEKPLTVMAGREAEA